MKRLALMGIFVIVPLVSAWRTGSVRADQVVSDAAHLCIQGPQFDYYSVVGPAGDSTLADTTGGGFQLNFRGLPHSQDDLGTYIVAKNHGECVSFIAANDDKRGSTGSPGTAKYDLVKAKGA